jgi:2-dehydropantoate 2-reductase
VKIAVVGAGGVGGYFGGRWAAAGRDVTFLARGAHLEALRDRGLSLKSPLGDQRVEVEATDSAEAVGQVDLVVVATKAWQVAEAVPRIQPLVGSHTILFGLQNGVEAADALARFAPGDRILGATCRIISFIREPGVVVHAGVEPTVVLGALPGSAPGLAESVFELLEGAQGVTLRRSAEIRVEIWKKFLFLASVSGVGAVTGAPIGVFRSVPETRLLLKAAMQEVMDVGVARGVDLPPASVADALAFIDGAPSEGTSSMQRDFRDGRRTELDVLSGAVARLGPEVGVPVPVHSMIYSVLLPRELRARGTLDFEVA